MQGMFLLLILGALPQMALSVAPPKDQWPVELRSHLVSYPSFPFNTFTSTMENYCGQSVDPIGNRGQAQLDFYSDPALEGRAPVKKIVKTSPAGPVAGPLFVIFSGIFNDIDNYDAQKLASIAIKYGHVAIFPSPLGHDFIAARPVYKMGNFLQEAEVLHRILVQVVRDFRQGQLLGGKGAHLVGISSGGFLASIVAARDSQTDQVLEGGTTLISPPANYRQSMSFVDGHILDLWEEYSGLSSLALYWRGQKVCWRAGSEDELEQWARGLSIIPGLQWKMVGAVEKLVRAQGEVWPDDDYGPVWSDSFHFAKYFDWYAAELIPLFHSTKVQLLDWVNQVNAAGKEIRIFTTWDDWLNTPSSWTNFSPSNMLLALDGGHLGFFYTSWFEKLLKGIFFRGLFPEMPLSIDEL